LNIPKFDGRGKIMKNRFLLLGFFLIVVSACDQDRINMSDVGGVDQITLTAISNDQTTVTIPDDFFGADLSAYSLDVYVNGTQIGADLDPSNVDYFDSNTGTIDFAISSVSDGDIINFVITDADGFSDSYSASVSESATTFAVSVAE